MITFRLDSQSGVPIYRQIQDQIRYGIASGLLKGGEQLPTVRAMAVELSVNPNTVIKAYSDLERDGVLTTEQGTGTFVAGLKSPALSDQSRQSKIESLCMEFLAQASRYGFSADDALKVIRSLARRKVP